MKKIFITGLTVIVPIGVVLWVLSIFLKIDTVINNWLGTNIFGLGLVILIGSIFGIGLLVSTRLGNWSHKKFDKFFRYIPMVKTAYGFTKDTIENILASEQSFKKVVLVKTPYGNEVGFITNEDTVFVPTSPNPTNGRTILNPYYTELDWTIEEGLKFVGTAGVIQKTQGGKQCE